MTCPKVIWVEDDVGMYDYVTSSLETPHHLWKVFRLAWNPWYSEHSSQKRPGIFSKLYAHDLPHCCPFTMCPPEQKPPELPPCRQESLVVQ